jgi:hypothetical protein
MEKNRPSHLASWSGPAKKSSGGDWMGSGEPTAAAITTGQRSVTW